MPRPGQASASASQAPQNHAIGSDGFQLGPNQLGLHTSRRKHQRKFDNAKRKNLI